MKKTTKKIIPILCLMLVLSLAACGAKTETSLELDAEKVYEVLLSLPDMPEMIQLPEDKAMDFLGLDQEDCRQAVTAICQNSMRADEIWIVEARDQKAAEKIKALAQDRVEQKKQEFESYSPEQYQVLEAAEIMMKDNYVILLVSPEIENVKEAFNEAAGIE